MGQLAFLRAFILVAIPLDANDNRRHVHVFKKEKDTFGLLPRFGLKVMANNVSK